MPHHLNLPAPEQPYSSSAPKPATTISHHHPNPDLIQPSNPSSFLLKHLSTLHITHKLPTPPHKHQSHTAKPPSATDVDSPNFSLPKQNTIDPLPRLTGKEKGKPSKRPSKLENPRKLQPEVERSELDDVHGSRVLFEDVKLENSNSSSRSRVPLAVEEEEEEEEEEHNDFAVVVKRHSSASLAHQSDGGGRRRSFCGGATKKVVDLGDVFAVNGVRVVSADMPLFMQIHAVDCARKAFDSMEKFTSKTLALTLKKEFDGVYGPAWHCIVGPNFGSFVTHSVGGFLYFCMDQKFYILLFKTAVQKAG